MKQSRIDSVKEVVTSTSIGMIGSWSITMLCLMFFTTPVGIATSTTIACTVFSLSRGYLIRRYFANKEQGKPVYE